jgi:hypothetical protein
LDSRLGGPQSWSRHCREDNNLTLAIQPVSHIYTDSYHIETSISQKQFKATYTTNSTLSEDNITFSYDCTFVIKMSPRSSVEMKEQRGKSTFL